MKIFPFVQEGIPFIIPPLIMMIVMLIFSWWIPAIPLFLLTVFLIWFFRSPSSELPLDPDRILSPADGTVLNVRKLEGPYQHRIDIFMSVFNIHVNLAPVTGRIEEVQYRKGEKGPASKDAASEKNESNFVEMASERGAVAFKQIAGILARRIVFYPVAGDELGQGESVGMIKFGSRVEVFLPENVSIEIEKGDKVRAGKTTLASWK